jgi:hypothetical protein
MSATAWRASGSEAISPARCPPPPAKVKRTRKLPAADHARGRLVHLIGAPGELAAPVRAIGG